MIGLVIVTFNASDYINRCLRAVSLQARRPDRIVLVDNASSDGTVEASRECAAALQLPIEIVKSDANLGFAAANNRAVERLHDCSLVATLNPDAFPEPMWLSALEDAANRHPEAASFASRLLVADDPKLLDGVGDTFHVSGMAWRVGHAHAAASYPGAAVEQAVFSACAAAALYRRHDWMQVGGFDERFFCYAEDVDLGFRLQLLDRGCCFVPAAVALHVGSAASGRHSEFAVYHGHRNLEWTFFKNMPARLLIRYAAAHAVAALAIVGWFVVKGPAGAVLRAKRDAVFGLGAILSERRRIQSARVLSDDALLARLDRSPLLQRFRERASRD